jgi:hypothetical protein
VTTWHDVESKLVDQPGTQQLLHHTGASNHLNRAVAGRGARLRDRRVDAIGYECEGQALILFRWRHRRMTREHEDWHLKLIVADV